MSGTIQRVFSSTKTVPLVNAAVILRRTEWLSQAWTSEAVFSENKQPQQNKTQNK